MTDNSNPNGKGKKPQDEKGGYEVGKGKPPKEHQFPPGFSGNLSGRPKKKPRLFDTMKEVLNSPITLTINGQKTTMTLQEALAYSLASKALKGSTKDQLGVIEFIRDLEKDAPGPFDSLFDD